MTAFFGARVLAFVGIVGSTWLLATWIPMKAMRDAPKQQKIIKEKIAKVNVAAQNADHKASNMGHQAGSKDEQEVDMSTDQSEELAPLKDAVFPPEVSPADWSRQVPNPLSVGEEVSPADWSSRVPNPLRVGGVQPKGTAELSADQVVPDPLKVTGCQGQEQCSVVQAPHLLEKKGSGSSVHLSAVEAPSSSHPKQQTSEGSSHFSVVQMPHPQKDAETEHVQQAQKQQGHTSLDMGNVSNIEVNARTDASPAKVPDMCEAFKAFFDAPPGGIRVANYAEATFPARQGPQQSSSDNCRAKDRSCWSWRGFKPTFKKGADSGLSFVMKSCEAKKCPGAKKKACHSIDLEVHAPSTVTPLDFRLGVGFIEKKALEKGVKGEEGFTGNIGVQINPVLSGEEVPKEKATRFQQLLPSGETKGWDAYFVPPYPEFVYMSTYDENPPMINGRSDDKARFTDGVWDTDGPDRITYRRQTFPDKVDHGGPAHHGGCDGEEKTSKTEKKTTPCGKENVPQTTHSECWPKKFWTQWYGRMGIVDNKPVAFSFRRDWGQQLRPQYFMTQHDIFTTTEPGATVPPHKNGLSEDKATRREIPISPKVYELTMKRFHDDPELGPEAWKKVLETGEFEPGVAEAIFNLEGPAQYIWSESGHARLNSAQQSRGTGRGKMTGDQLAYVKATFSHAGHMRFAEIDYAKSFGKSGELKPNGYEYSVTTGDVVLKNEEDIKNVEE